MRPIRHILVAVKDPGAKSSPAVAKAAQLALATGAALELFHAIADAICIDALAPEDPSLGQIKSRSRARSVEQLEAIAAPLRRRGLEVSTRAEWDYPIYEAVVRRATAIKADLIVAARHATRHVAPWLLRFNDWELLRLSKVPVLLVKSALPYSKPVILATVDPTHAFAKPARLDHEILSQAQLLKDALQGRVHALHAWQPLSSGNVSDEMITLRITLDIEAKARNKAKRDFERVLRGSGIPRSRQHFVDSRPVSAIRRVVSETGCAIVVMGAISRSGLKRAFIGNTAEKVLDSLACDVLVVKPSRFPSRVASSPRGARIVTAPPLA